MKVIPFTDDPIFTKVEGSCIVANVRVDLDLGFRVARLALDSEAVVGIRGNEFVMVVGVKMWRCGVDRICVVNVERNENCMCSTSRKFSMTR
jgi:hypothetical protein